MMNNILNNFMDIKLDTMPGVVALWCPPPMSSIPPPRMPQS